MPREDRKAQELEDRQEVPLGLGIERRGRRIGFAHQLGPPEISQSHEDKKEQEHEDRVLVDLRGEEELLCPFQLGRLSLVRPGRTRFSEQEEGKAGESHEREREDHDVDHEKAVERENARGRPAFEEAGQEVSDDGNDARHLDSHDASPVGLLIPREKVAGEAEADHDLCEEKPHDPDHLVRLLVRPPQEDLCRVDDQHDDHGRRTPVMDSADEPAVVHVFHDVADRLPGVVHGGRVVEHHEDGRHDLHRPFLPCHVPLLAWVTKI